VNALSVAHLVVLAWVRYHPGATVTAISEGLGADAADVVAVCDDLAEAGLIVAPTYH